MDKKLYLIRGARIIQQLEQLDERSYQDLEQQTLRFIPPTTRRQFAVGPVQIARLQLLPAKNTGELKIETDARSGPNTYHPVLMFSEVIYEDTDESDNISFTSSDGVEYHIIPIQLSRQNVKVRCDCLDFYFRFSPYNNRDGSLYGNPTPPYQRRTTTHPPANPRRTPGVCKHIMRVVQELRNQRVVA